MGGGDGGKEWLQMIGTLLHAYLCKVHKCFSGTKMNIWLFVLSISNVVLLLRPLFDPRAHKYHLPGYFVHIMRI